MLPYPLIFEPILKDRLWGGQRLEFLLGKKIPRGPTIGESWELADLPGESSVVANGPARGRRISELAKEWGNGLMGRAGLFEGRFPLLIKFLDASRMLSVQVHPSSAAAAKSGGRWSIKNEAWYVVEASADAFIYHGLRAGCTVDNLRIAVRDGSVETVLRRIPARKGHCYYLPSGTVHALGGEIVVAEVQTPCDVTFRLFDWNRIDPLTGRPRELHVDQALDSAIVDSADAEAVPEHTASVWTTVTRLVQCESFILERVRMVEGVELVIPYEELAVWIVLEGKGTIACEGISNPVAFGRGDTVLLPAGMKKGCVRTLLPCLWLEVTVPTPSSLSEWPRPERASLQPRKGAEETFVPLGRPEPDRASE